MTYVTNDNAQVQNSATPEFSEVIAERFGPTSGGRKYFLGNDPPTISTL